MRLIKLLVFAVAIFAAALLMFVIEPLVAKMLLPSFGGSPSVWNTCVVFFQITLLIGYCYAHWLSKTVASLRQIVIHIIVIWLPLLLLPIRMNTGFAQIDHPFLDVLIMVAGMVGLCFFAISTTAPLLQKWYSQSGGAGSDDPYFLYAASNAGGLTGLVLYPFVLEPSLRIVEQTQLVLYIYVVYASLVTVCALAFYTYSKRSGSDPSDPSGQTGGTARDTTRVDKSIDDWRYRARIVFYAVVPASLSLGLTSYVANELSPIPFFWLVPLFIYLLSFIIAFSRLPSLFARIWRWLALPLSLAVVVLSTSSLITHHLMEEEITSGISLHLAALFFVCCAFHSKLAQERPSTEFLTSYYFLISVGGILGSAFNTFVAPTVFDTSLEYPLVFALAGIALAAPIRFPAGFKFSGLARLVGINDTKSFLSNRPIELTVVVSLAVLALTSISWSIYQQNWGDKPPVDSQLVIEVLRTIAFQVAIPIGFCLLVARTSQQLRIGLAIVTIFMLNNSLEQFSASVYMKRNFFGSLYVIANRPEGTCQLYHGSTMHGSEYIDPELKGIPLSYYFSANGQIGSLMTAMFGPPQTLRQYQSEHESKENAGIESADAIFSNPQATLTPQRNESASSSEENDLPPIAVLGLGCGSTVAYAREGQIFSFFEIDPDVIEIASNPFYFTFLFQAKARGVDTRIVQGDGRLGIQKAPYKFYKMLLVDAFNADFIPTHLITKEALEVYLSKVQDDGIVGFNISNRYYDFKPVLFEASKALKVPAYTKFEYRGAEPDDTVQQSQSEWVLFSKSDRIREFLSENGWRQLKTDKKTRLWTDDYCSPLNILISPFS